MPLYMEYPVQMPLLPDRRIATLSRLEAKYEILAEMDVLGHVAHWIDRG